MSTSLGLHIYSQNDDTTLKIQLFGVFFNILFS